MTLTSPSFILLVLICVGAWLIGGPASKAVKNAEMDLSADELKTFRERYRKSSRRRDMPTKFKAIAEASDRAARIWLISAVAVTVTIVWTILAGPGLGLFEYP